MTDWPKVDKFLSEDEIIEVEFKKLMSRPDDVKEFLKHGPGAFHHTYGMWVRNHYHLWHPENPHTMKDYVEELIDGVDHSPRHADNFSGRVLDKLYERFKTGRTKTPNF